MTQHHYPAEPGAVQSEAFPHMAVEGSYRDMLNADVRLTRHMVQAREQFLDDVIAEWQGSTGPVRVRNRGYVASAISHLRAVRVTHRAAFARLTAYIHSIQRAA